MGLIQKGSHNKSFHLKFTFNIYLNETKNKIIIIKNIKIKSKKKTN